MQKSATTPHASPVFPAGIPNGPNCCFLASVILALGASPSFRKRLDAIELRPSPVIQELRKIYNILDGKNGQEKRALTGDEIAHFRNTCIESGMYIDNSVTQESADDAAVFLLYQAGLELYNVKETNKHDLGVFINALEKGRPYETNMVFLEIGDPTVELKEIKEVTKRKMVVEVEPQLVRNNYLEEKIPLTPQIEETLGKMKSKEQLDVEQSLELDTKSLPSILSICVKRENYDFRTGQNTYNTRKVTPSHFVDFPLTDMPGHSARYEFMSAVVRNGALTDSLKQTISINSGHYTAWVQYHQKKDQPLLVQYDSGSVQAHTDSAAEAMEYMSRNSRLHFYEFRQIVKTS